MPNPNIDAIDRRILEALQRDGRLTNLELAERAGLSPSPCLRRVRLMEKDGIIEGYGARLNRVELGLGLTAFVAVNIERHSSSDANQIKKALAAMPEVVALYITSGEHDFLLHVVVPDLEEYRRFSLERLINVPGIKELKSSFAIETVKENGPLPLYHIR